MTFKAQGDLRAPEEGDAFAHMWIDRNTDSLEELAWQTMWGNKSSGLFFIDYFILWLIHTYL